MSDAPQSPLPLLDPDRVAAIANEIGPDDVVAIARRAVDELDLTGYTAQDFAGLEPINQQWYIEQVQDAMKVTVQNRAEGQEPSPLIVDLTEDTTGQVEVASDEWAQATQIAQVCHAANRAWSIAAGDAVVFGSWEEVDEELQRSTIEGVLKALDGATPEQLHETWCTFKTEHGWVYGPVKDPEAKTHPCLVPYDELPESDRKKDDLFQAVVAALAKGVVDQRVAGSAHTT